MFRRMIINTMLLTSLLSAGALLLPSVVSAAPAPRANCSKESSSFLGFPTWYKFLEPDGSSGECKLTFPEDADGNQSLILAAPRILLAVFEIILRIAGLAAVGFVIFGGIQYILSQGEPERTKSSKNTIVNALVGLAIALSATAIVNLIGNNIT